MIDSAAIELFRKTVLDYYQQSGRHDLPWRQPEADGGFDPYKILVSELMLQQTQVNRVIPKYHAFLEHFPSYQALADSDLAAVLIAWSGLGYNRRAKFLWLAAQNIQTVSTFPRTYEELVALPGVGKNTAGATLAYAFNKPAIFIETNIRTVYIHHFFTDRQQIDDRSILAYLERTILGYEDPRMFYWALMDYGTYLKTTIGNLNALSKSYSKQSSFEGSRRQIRGQIITLLSQGNLTLHALAEHITDDRLQSVADDLEREALIVKIDDTYKLA